MNKSESIQNLSAALSKAQAEMPAIKFDSKNPFPKNDYASLGAIIAGARPVIAKHGLSVAQLTFGEDGDGNKPEPTRKPARTKPEAQANDDIMTIERASKVTNSEGTPYVDIASDVLQRMVIGINKGLQNSADEEKRAEYLEKKQAIGVILKARADKSI